MVAKWVKGLLLAAIVAVLLVPLAFADGSTTVSVSGGSLSISNPTIGVFGGVTLTGVATTTTASLATFTVTDSTGSGSGWHVNAAATQFTEWDTTAGDYVPGGKTIATGSLQMSQPSVTANGTDSAAPSITSGPYTIDGTSVKIASAALGAGMGKYDFGATTLTLSLPASVYAKTYQSNVTIDVVAGP